MNRPPRAVRFLRRYTDQQPFEVYMATLCVIVGVPLILNGAAPETIEETLPPFLVHLWGLELGAGATLTLFGLGAENDRLERGGLLLLAAASLSYGLILLAFTWPNGRVAAALIIGFGLACMARRSAMRRTVTLRTGTLRDR